MEQRRVPYTGMRIPAPTETADILPAEAPASSVAESDAVTAALEREHLQCPLCWSLLHIPLCTPCGHSYCRCVGRGRLYKSRTPERVPLEARTSHQPRVRRNKLSQLSQAALHDNPSRTPSPPLQHLLAAHGGCTRLVTHAVFQGRTVPVSRLSRAPSCVVVGARKQARGCASGACLGAQGARRGGRTQGRRGGHWSGYSRPWLCCFIG